MKKISILVLCLMLEVSAFASSEISRRPLQVPEDQSISVQNDDRISMLEREIQTLLGRVEVLEHTVSALRSGQAASAPASQGLVASPPAAIPSGSLGSVPESTSQVDTSPQVAAVAGSAEKREYDSALLALKDSKFEDAEGKFANFIAKYPKSGMLSNAYFWYGETFFRRNNFEKAAINYLKGYKQFPKAAKAADSLLKLALSLGAMGKTQEACSMLGKLEAEFKDRPASSIKRAKDARNKYGCK